MSKKSRHKSSPPAATRWWPVVVILLAGIGAYASSFAGVFVFDDIHNVAENPFLRRLWPPWEAMFRSPSLPTRPLPYLTFAINYAIGGIKPWGYHAVNLAIHLGAAVALLEIVRRTLELSNVRWKLHWPATGLALAVALIWVVHPIQTQAVTYVYQRLESLMGLCFLLTLLTFIVAMQAETPRQKWWLALSVLFCAAGMASKEVMIVAPVVLLWYDRAFIARSWNDLVNQRWRYYAGLAATWGVLALVVWSQRGQYAEMQTPPHTRAEYFLNQPRVVLWYLRLMVWPQGQCLDYGWQPTDDWAQILPALALMLVLLTATGWLIVKHPPLGFVAGSFFLVLSVTSSVLVVADLAMEHRMYLPSAALITLAVLGVHQTIQWAARRSPLEASWPRWLPGCLLAGVTLALMVATYQRNRTYRDYLTMWEDVVAKSDFHVRACRNVIQTYAARGEPDRGIELCRQQVARNPGSVLIQCLLGESLFLARRYDEAQAAYEQALARNPEFEDAIYSLGLVEAERGNHEQAVAHFRRAIERFPQFQKAYHAQGKSLAVLGRGNEAADSFRRAIEIGRYNTEAMQDLAVILDVQGKTDEAIALLKEYLEVHPDHLSAWDSLGLAYSSRGKYLPAAEAFREVLVRDPLQWDSRRSQAQALVAAGKYEDAAGVLAQGVQLAQKANQSQVAQQFSLGLAEVQRAWLQAESRPGVVNQERPSPSP